MWWRSNSRVHVCLPRYNDTDEDDDDEDDLITHEDEYVRFTCPGITSLGTEFIPREWGSLDLTHQPWKTTTAVCVHHQSHVTFKHQQVRLHAPKCGAGEIRTGFSSINGAEERRSNRNVFFPKILRGKQKKQKKKRRKKANHLSWGCSRWGRPDRPMGDRSLVCTLSWLRIKTSYWFMDFLQLL